MFETYLKPYGTMNLLLPDQLGPEKSGFSTQNPSPDASRSKSHIFFNMARNTAVSLTGSFEVNSSRISRVVARPGSEHPVEIKFRISAIVCS